MKPWAWRLADTNASRHCRASCSHSAATWAPRDLQHDTFLRVLLKANREEPFMQQRFPLCFKDDVCRLCQQSDAWECASKGRRQSKTMCHSPGGKTACAHSSMTCCASCCLQDATKHEIMAVTKFMTISLNNFPFKPDHASSCNSLHCIIHIHPMQVTRYAGHTLCRSHAMQVTRYAGHLVHSQAVLMQPEPT